MCYEKASDHLHLTTYLSVKQKLVNKMLEKRSLRVKGVLMSVLVSVQNPELMSPAGTFPDLCPSLSPQDPHRPRSPSRRCASRSSSPSLRCPTSSVNQQTSSEVRPHFSFFLPPSSAPRFPTASISYPRLVFLFLSPSFPPTAGFGLQAGRPRPCLHFAGTRARPPASVHACKTSQSAGIVH